MALTRTNQIGAASTDSHGTGAFTTGSFTPPDNSLLVVYAGGMDPVGSAGFDDALTMAGGGLTFTPRVSEAGGDGSSFSIAAKIWTAPVTTGASMTLSLDAGARSLQFGAISAVAYTGYDTGTPTGGIGVVIDVASPDGAQSLTLDAAPASADEVFAGITIDKETAGTTPGATFSEIHDLDVGGPGGIQTQIRTGSTSTTVDWVDTETAAGNIYKIVAAAVVIKAGAAAAAAPAGSTERNPLGQFPYVLSSDASPWATRVFQPPVPMNVWANDNAPNTQAATVSATAIATTAAMAAPAVQTGSTVAATAIVTTTGMVAPTITAVTAHTATAIVTTTGMSAPAVQTGSTVAATVVATTTAIPAVTPATVVDAVAVATVTALPAPAVQTGSTVAATTIATVTALPLPTVDTAGNATVQPVAIVTVAALPAPTVQQGQTVSATSVATVTALPAPAVQTGVGVSPATVATVTAITAPTLSVETVVSPVSLATVSTLPALVVQTGSTVGAGSIATVTTLPLPAVSGNVATGIQGNVYPPNRAVSGDAYPRQDGGIIGSVA